MQRDFSGNLLKTASTEGSINSTPSAFHKYRQHSINFISAASPPAFKSGSTFFYRQPEASFQLFVHNVLPEHCPLLTPVTLLET